MSATATIAPPRVADRKMLIDGKWVDSASGKTFETINPATGDTICRVAEGDAADVDLAVKAAKLEAKTEATEEARKMMNEFQDRQEKMIDSLLKALPSAEILMKAKV